MKTTLQTLAISSIDFTPEKRISDIEWINPKSWLGGLITRDGGYRWRADGRELMLGEEKKLRIGDLGFIWELAMIEIHMTSGLVYYKRYTTTTLAEKEYKEIIGCDFSRNITLEDYDCTRD